MNAIEIDGVSKRYGDVQALDDLSLSVDRGTTLGVFGTNGAGKTTLFKLLVGLDDPDAGAVRVAGVDPTTGTEARERVRYLPEQAGFPANLTGREILRFNARMRSIPSAKRARHVERILHTVGLSAAADRRVGDYSNGMNRRLGLGTALVGDPDVLLLDEPTAGLDPDGVRSFHGIVDRLAGNTDVTVVFSSHALTEIERLCERAVVVADGELAVDGSVEELRRAAADEVTLSLTFDDAETATAVASELRDRRVAGAVTQSTRTVGASCPPEAAYELLTRVGESFPIDRFEVREPGLEGLFHDVVGTRESGSAVDSEASETGGEPA